MAAQGEPNPPPPIQPLQASLYNVYMCRQHLDKIDNVCLCKQCVRTKL